MLPVYQTIGAWPVGRRLVGDFRSPDGTLLARNQPALVAREATRLEYEQCCAEAQCRCWPHEPGARYFVLVTD